MNIGRLKTGNVPRVAAVILDGEDKKALAAAKRGGADLLELRIDYFKRHDDGYLQRVIRDIKAEKLPLIVTIRSREEGGKSDIEETERLKLFRSIIPLADAVDIELGSKKILKSVIREAHRFNKKVIVSYHDFAGTPQQWKLEAIIKKGKEAGGDIVKIATFTESKRDVAKLLLLTASHNDIIATAMGRCGAVARILFPIFGSLITYASVTEASAPGQVPLRATTELLKLLGKKI